MDLPLSCLVFFKKKPRFFTRKTSFRQKVCAHQGTGEKQTNKQQKFHKTPMFLPLSFYRELKIL